MDIAFRRSMDILLATSALFLLTPILAVIPLLVRFESPGPILFRQERVGRNGSHFILYKFRTMHTRQDEHVSLVTASNDPRITRFGHVLRSLKLDELPQLVNVVRGNMSITGPRPEVAEYVAKWPERHRDTILSVRPGLTDPVTLQLTREEHLLAQYQDPAEYYEAVLLPSKAHGYASYVTHRTISGDLSLIFKTLWSIFKPIR